ncbi:MAG: hypothetical protein AAB557_05745 [Patescibacteria group bacterium]|mgnify:CR=1 FL=1
MVAIETNTPRMDVLYAGSNPVRLKFLEHVAGEDAHVIALGGGIELQAPHPLSVAKRKIEFAQKIQGGPEDCYVAFDALTFVPTGGVDGLIYEVRGKPKNDEEIQRLFWEMKHRDPLPYRIRAASALVCGDVQKTAWHDTSISLSPQGLSWLASDAGLAAYAAHIKAFGYQFSQTQHPSDFAAGLNLETLLATGCVESINDVWIDQQGFEIEMQRALFLATVGASHQVLGPLTHTPMDHIITFPHHMDRLALLEKYIGAT